MYARTSLRKVQTSSRAPGALSARLQPVRGKKAGDRTEFESQYLFNTTVHESVSR